jgi:hypothetical protein
MIDGEAGFFTDELPLSELASAPERVLGNGASAATLHYCSPAHGGWGVIRTALLVPESCLFFACPSACGRHGAIAAIEQGQRHRIGYLCLDDNEIVLGGYEAEIERGVREFLSRVKFRPRALMLVTSCIDDLLGTDHTAALARLEAEQGIPIRRARMDPISLDGKLPPGVRVQKTMYEFLKPAAGEKDRGIIILGSYRPPPQDSELARFLAFCGYGPPRHPEYCPGFESFRAMSQSAAALLLRPEGKAAGEDIAGRLHIPVLPAFMSFDKEHILTAYQRIGEFLAGLPDGPVGGAPTSREELESFFHESIKRTEELAREARSVLGGARVALDSTVTAAPFGLALALVKSGIKVNRIYANQLPAFERPRMAELARLDSDITVINPNHARKYGKRPRIPLADIALGFEAGYAAAAPVTVPLAFDEQMYGFEGYAMVLEGLLAFARKGESDLHQQLKEYGLVI